MQSARTDLCLTSNGFAIDMSPECFGLIEDSTPLLNDIVELRRRLDENGYLYLSNFHIRNEVLAARRFVLERLAEEGKLDPRFPLMDGVVKEGEALWFEPRLAQKNNQPLQTLLYRLDGPLMSFFRRFFDAPVAHFDYTWLRVLSRGHGTSAHADIVYMGRGTRNLFTAWTPIGDAPLEMGGLIVLEKSHKLRRLHQTYSSRDVDGYCLNRPKDAARRKSDFTGVLGKDANQIRRSLGGRWLGGSFSAGDVVIFSTYLVHAGLDNQTNRVRISSDSRYQRADEPRDERWIGDDPAAHGPNAKRGRIC